MGKGSKHNSAKPRSNGIFKVAGQNFKSNQKKGKAKEITSNLKLLSRKNSSKVAELDETLSKLRETCNTTDKCINGEKPKGRQVGSKFKEVESVAEAEIDDLAACLDKTS